jgi:hypothetical protein
MPSITENSLISTSKFANAGYTTVFEKDKVTIYNTLKRKLVVPREAILRGWHVGDLWQIPLVKMVMNNNMDTVLVDKPPTKFLPEQPHPSEAIHNVYELKMQPELVRYLHATDGYPMKPPGSKPSKTSNLPHGQASQ